MLRPGNISPRLNNFMEGWIINIKRKLIPLDLVVYYEAKFNDPTLQNIHLDQFGSSRFKALCSFVSPH